LTDSITLGTGSSDGNGYREFVYSNLTSYSNTVNMIGSIQAGSMAENDNEGISSGTINQISSAASSSLSESPDIVLLMAGTYDMSSNADNAPADIGSLIQQIFAAAPDTAVLVATLPPSTDAGLEANIEAFNALVPGTCSDFISHGSLCWIVDMWSALTTDDLSTDILPNEAGYQKMAAAWLSAIDQITALDWLD
jgi:lysophospholipase L1-like esterase